MAILPPTPKPPTFIPNIVQSTANQIPVAPIVPKNIAWSHKKKGTNFNTRSLHPVDEAISDKIATLVESIRVDLSQLRQLYRAIMEADHFDPTYKKNNTNKSEEYTALLQRVNELSRETPSEEVLNELQIIEDEVEFDCATVDNLFPQMVYKATYMESLMAIRVDLIGYAELKAEALAALRGIRTAVSEMTSTLNTEHKNKNKDNDNDYDLTSIATVVHTINIYDEMQKYKQNILDLQSQDQKRTIRTSKNVLTGIAIVFAALTAVLVFLNYEGVTWRDIRIYPLLGIPMGVVIWSFIGSFAAMLSQFYQKPVHEFGNTLKWVIIRPVLGVVMGAAVYLAFVSLGIVDRVQNSSLLPLLIAFFVGYSDTFTFDILNTIQRTITGLFTAGDNAPTTNLAAQQPVYILPADPPTPISPSSGAAAPSASIPTPPTVGTAPTTSSSGFTTPNNNDHGEDEQ
ncbi:MAG: hypothetical protein AB8E82_20715 [Aureispira sp.]